MKLSNKIPLLLSIPLVVCFIVIGIINYNSSKSDAIFYANDGKKNALKGCIEFGIKDNGVIVLNQFDSISLPANVVHNLLAIDDAIVRLSISSLDTKDRVDRILLS